MMNNDLKTAIIVDDALIMLKRLEHILKELGYEVVAKAKTGQEAYLSYKKHQPDFITMDITMPNMDGVKAVEKIKDDFPEAVIIMITAIKYKSMVLQTLQMGAKHYITKPINEEKVEERLTEVEKIIAEEKKKVVNDE